MRNSTLIEIAKQEAIKESFYKLKKENPELTIKEAADIIIKLPAPRFYCNYESALRMVSLLDRGKELPITNENKMAMYKDIYRIWSEKEIDTTNQLDKRGKYIHTLPDVLSSPAPSFYLSKDTIIGLISKPIKRRR